MSIQGRVLLAFAVWLLAAIAFGAAGGLRMAPAPFAQLVLLTIFGALLAIYAASPGLRGWLYGLPRDALVAVHLSRFVGFYLLYLHGQGQLPREFAVTGGWGDILVAFVAAALIAARRLGNTPPPIAYLLWNAFGLLDMVFVVGTAGHLAVTRPGSMDALLRLPLSLLPCFLVPLVLFAHVVLMLRLPPLARKERA